MIVVSEVVFFFKEGLGGEFAGIKVPHIFR